MTTALGGVARTLMSWPKKKSVERLDVGLAGENIFSLTFGRRVADYDAMLRARSSPRGSARAIPTYPRCFLLSPQTHRR